MRYSKQREVVYDVLCSTRTHPDVSYIYAEARKVLPNISLGTVYRNLQELCESDRARRLSTEGSAERFDANMCSHAHFTCRHCGKIFDVDSPAVDTDCALGQVEKCDVMLYGVCNVCKQSSEKNN